MDTLSHIVDDIRLTGAVFLRTELAGPWALRLHTPGLASFHIVVQGSAWLVPAAVVFPTDVVPARSLPPCREASQDPLRLEAGDLVILPGGLDHRLQDTLDNDAVPHDLLPELDQLRTESLQLGGQGELARTLSGHFRFDVEMARPLVDALPPLIAIQTRGAMPPTWLRLGIQFIADEFSTRRLAQQAVTNRIADLLLIEVLRHHLESLPEGSGNWLAALRDKGLSAALAAMHAEPGRGWTVPELAEIAHLSRSAFADRFGQVMGQPPLAYLTDHRMRLAAWKLAHSRLSIAQIAEQVGYGSETAFSQAFKRHHGEPPSKMRGS